MPQLTDDDYARLAHCFTEVSAQAIDFPEILSYENALEFALRISQHERDTKVPLQNPTETIVNEEEFPGSTVRAAQAKYWGNYFCNYFSQREGFELKVPMAEDRVVVPEDWNPKDGENLRHFFPGWRIITERASTNAKAARGTNIKDGLVAPYTAENSTYLAADARSIFDQPFRSPALEADIVFHEMVHRIWSLYNGPPPRLFKEKDDYKKLCGLEEAICDYFAMLLARQLKVNGGIDERFHKCIGVLHAFYWRDADPEFVNRVIETCEERGQECPEFVGTGNKGSYGATSSTNNENLYAKRNYNRRLEKTDAARWRANDEHCHGHIFADALFMARDDLSDLGMNEQEAAHFADMFDAAVWEYFISSNMYSYDKFLSAVLNSFAVHAADRMQDVVPGGRKAVIKIMKDAYVTSGASPNFIRKYSLKPIA